MLDELPAGRLACHLPDSETLVATMLAASCTGRSVIMLNHDFGRQQITPLLDELDIAVLLTHRADIAHARCLVVHEVGLRTPHNPPASPPRPATAGDELLILTSGTTGKPKCARYEWQQLFAQVRPRDEKDEERWLLAYRLSHFAGLQMIAHIIKNRGTLVIPDSTQVKDAIRAIGEHQVTHVSSTPTFWRYSLSLLAGRRNDYKIQHITLGSEAPSADLLNSLHQLFPDARIVHIYASTESGSCISVSDLKPGLPASILGRPQDADVRFRIIADELHVKTKHGMSGYLNQAAQSHLDDAGWRATGDLVRIEKDRILFVGRKNETINVGGAKVYPLDVESIILPVPGVLLARVFGRPNPIVGQIVAAEVVLDKDSDQEAVESAIRSACESLPPTSRPRSIEFVDSIEMTNLKVVRRQHD